MTIVVSIIAQQNISGFFKLKDLTLGTKLKMPQRDILLY
jgi:hypothetical protein